MDLNKYRLTITRHALLQALERGIDPDLVEQIIMKGKMVRFGKNNVKFVAKGKCTLIAVGEIVGGRIKIFTVVEGN